MVEKHPYHIFYATMEKTRRSLYTATKPNGKGELYRSSVEDLAKDIVQVCYKTPGLRPIVDHAFTFNFTPPYEYIVNNRGELYKNTLLSDEDKAQFLSTVAKIQTDNFEKDLAEYRNRQK